MRDHSHFALLLASLYLVAFGLGFTAPSQAQDDAKEISLARGAAQADVTPTAVVQGSEPSLILESSEDGAFLTGKIGFSKALDENRLQFLVQLRAPFDKKTQQEVGFVNFDGLTGGTAGKVSITLEHVGPMCDFLPCFQRKPFRASVSAKVPTLGDLCLEANETIKARFESRRAGHGSLTTCSRQELEKEPFWQGELLRRESLALGELCTEVNKRRGIDLLAPPGEDPQMLVGFSERCTVDSVIADKESEIKILLRTKAVARIASGLARDLTEQERTRAINSQLPGELDTVRKAACDVYNKERSDGRLFDPSAPPAAAGPPFWLGPCSAGNLARGEILAAYESKKKAAVMATCRDRLTTPTNQLFLVGNPATNNCRLSSFLEFASASPAPGRWYRRALKTIPLPLWYLTLEGTLTDQTFQYLDPEDGFEKKKDSSDSQSYGIAASRFKHGRMLSLGFSRQKTFKASASTEVCLPLTDSGALSCKTTALAGPTRKDINALRGEVRQLINSHVGASLRAIYQLDENEWEVHGIFHFLRDPKQGLNGGIDLQYNTQPLNQDMMGQGGDHFTARLFIGTRFELPFLPGGSS